MNQEIDLKEKVYAFLLANPADRTFTSTQVLEGALGIKVVDEDQGDVRLFFRFLRQYAEGSLSAFCTRGKPYQRGRSLARPYIWHSRPRGLAPAPYTAADEPEGFTVRDHLHRIEGKVNMVWGELGQFDVLREKIENAISDFSNDVGRIESKVDRILQHLGLI